MVFNSFEYVVFLPIVFVLYWVIPHKFRWLLLLITSYYFYMSWNPKYVVLILATTAVSYTAALLLEKYPYLTPKEVKLRLLERARDLGLPRNQQGRGMVDLAALLRE